jgi:hypothetical protein
VFACGMRLLGSNVSEIYGLMDVEKGPAEHERQHKLNNTWFRVEVCLHAA